MTFTFNLVSSGTRSMRLEHADTIVFGHIYGFAIPSYGRH